MIVRFHHDERGIATSWDEVGKLVRCKDCKWYELPSHKITENCVRWMKSNGILLPIKPNDYCSYAERREDG